MILNHLMGLYTHPKQEWHAIEQNHEALKSSLSHVLLIALIPAVCSFIATAYIGWNPGAGDPIYLTPHGTLPSTLVYYDCWADWLSLLGLSAICRCAHYYEYP